MPNGNLTIAHRLHKVVFLMNKIEDKILQENFNLPLTQFRILMSIADKTGCQSRIAEQWGISDAAISKQIDALMANRYIQRQENPENRRQYTLVLTPKGKLLFNSARKKIEKEYDSTYKGLSPTEKVALVKGLEKIESGSINNHTQEVL